MQTLSSKSAVLALLISSMAPHGALAQGGHTVVGESVSATVSAGDTVAVAAAASSRAVVRQGSISGSRIAGSARLTASGGDSYAVAAPLATARIVESSIIGGRIGEAYLVSRTPMAASIAALPGSSTCVALASSGPSAVGPVNSMVSTGPVYAFNYGILRRAKVRIGTIGDPCRE